MRHENDGGPCSRPPSGGGQPDTREQTSSCLWGICNMIRLSIPASLCWCISTFIAWPREFSRLVPLPALSNFPLCVRRCKHPALCRKLKNSLSSPRPPLLSSYLSVFLSVRHSDQLPFFKSMDRREPTFPRTKLHGGQISAAHVKLLMEHPRPLLFSPPRLRAEGHWETTEISADSLCISTRDSVTAGVQTGSPGP